MKWPWFVVFVSLIAVILSPFSADLYSFLYSETIIKMRFVLFGPVSHVVLVILVDGYTKVGARFSRSFSLVRPKHTPRTDLMQCSSSIHLG